MLLFIEILAYMPRSVKRVSEFQTFFISSSLHKLVFSSQVPVPTGLVTPVVPIKTVIPSPPQKRRRLAIDRNTQLDAGVIRRNVNTEGRETLREQVRNNQPCFTSCCFNAFITYFNKCIRGVKF